MPIMDGYAATGCNDHLTKPLKAKELVETVAHFAQSIRS